MMAELLHFEDFPVGRKFAFGSYEVTKEEIFEFAREFDPQPHHLDEEAAKSSMLKGLSASGWHVCAITMRIFADHMISRAAGRGGVGSREARWMKPVRPGDVLRLEAEVVEAKASSSKPVGFVTFDCRVFNQIEQVALISMTPIIARRA
jgi:acyl dehydratase